MEASIRDPDSRIKFTRRRFIKIGWVSLILILIGILLFDFRKTVRRMIQRDTKSLRLPDGTIDKFMADADREGFWRQFGMAKRALINVQDALGAVGIHTPWYGKYLKYRNEITGRLLFSTDLFQSKYNEGQAVTYLGFHNPYKAPCSNPFSALRSL
jgi:hypothetical protein